MLDNSKSSKSQPVDVYILSFTELWDRFSYYGIQALLVLYVTKVFLFSDNKAYSLYGAYTALTFATPVIGGFIADRFLGFYRTVIIGAILLIAGNVILIFPGLNFLFLGLALIICSIGLFKPNNASLIGMLYQKGSTQREGGFAILYTAMNAGALLGPISYGFMEAHLGWHYGFALTAISAFIALLILLMRGQQLNQSSINLSQKTNIGLSVNQLFYSGIIIVVLLFTLLLQYTNVFSNLLDVFGIITIIGLAIIALRSISLERNRIFAMTAMAFFCLFFFACSLQTATSLTLFIEREVNRNILGWHIPTMMFLSLEPFFIILTAPFLTRLWHWLNQYHLEPAPPLKIAFGLILASISFMLFTLAARGNLVEGAGALINITLGNLTLGLGELCVFPVMLSTVSHCAPYKMRATFMGIVFLANSFAGYLAGIIAQLISVANTKQTAQASNYAGAFMQKLYAQATGTNKAEIYRHLFISENILLAVLAKINIAHWKRSYIQLGCLLKWQLSEAYIEVAKISNDESSYRDALSSWIYSGTNDVLKTTLAQLL